MSPIPKRRLLVTTALPYANGSLHLGHMVEKIQADIWVRFQKMRGHECWFVSGEDAHGTPIMLKAHELDISPEAYIEQIRVEHEKDDADFFIDYDQFYTTHSAENRELVELIYAKLNAKGDIEKRCIQQAYDPQKQMFLPDRFIKGDCPRCGASGQYGDSCESCGATYSPTELKNPISVISGATPIQKESEHYFFKLENYAELLEKWINSGHLQEEVAHKLKEWFDVGLKSWDISRDSPYFGFEIPGAPGKYFYVWLDAPVGYMTSFNKLAEEKNLDFDEFWGKDSNAELYHFIGKDIVYFHTLFWPAMLAGSDFRLPTGVFVHGFLTVDGQKMSKSRGTFINARSYLDHFAAEYLRYYFAAKLSSRVEDIDINFDDFMNRVNADLVGKIVNIASRTAGFIEKMFEGILSSELDDKNLYWDFVQEGETIATLYEAREFSSLVRQITKLADRANQYIDEKKPWGLAKQAGNEQMVQDVCTQGLNLFRVMMIYLKPILPSMAKQVEDFMDIPPLTWETRVAPLLKHHIKPFKPLMQRIDKKQIIALQSALATQLA